MKLVFCKDPKDYVDMYTNGIRSCMQNEQFLIKYPNAPASEVRLRDALYKAHKTWPSVFYHYYPNTQGVMLVNARGTILARTLLLKQDEDKEFKTYGNIYGSYSEKERMEQYLKRAGYVSVDNEDALAEDCVGTQQRFEVPAIDTIMGVLCPWPFSDHIEVGEFGRMHYDKAKKVFVFNSKSAKAVNLYTEWYEAPNYIGTDGNAPFNED